MNDQLTHDYYRDSSSARLSVLIIVCIGSFLMPMSLSATLVAIPAIARDLQADAIYVSWIPAIFLLSNLVMLLPTGRLADIYGRKRIYLIGSIVFLVATVLAAFSTSISMLLFFRSVQGVGAALFFGTSMAIITSVFLHKGRGEAMGWVVAAVYAGLTCGPFLGGWLTDTFGWRSVFLFQAPLALIGVVLLLTKVKGEWRSKNALKLDIVGAVLLGIGLITLFIGISKLPEPYALVALVLSASFITLFLRHTKQSPNPIIKLKLVWENRVFSNALLASSSMYGGQYGLVFILGLYLQYNQGLSPTEAGQLIMLQAIIMAVLAPMAGRLSDNYKPWLLAAAGCCSVAIGISL
ncbi:MAG: MFS transporter, partial [Cocleimonas sp.]